MSGATYYNATIIAGNLPFSKKYTVEYVVVLVSENKTLINVTSFCWKEQGEHFDS